MPEIPSRRVPPIDEGLSAGLHKHWITALQTFSPFLLRASAVGGPAMHVEVNAWCRRDWTRSEEEIPAIRPPSRVGFESGPAGQTGQGLFLQVENPNIVFFILGTDGELFSVRRKPRVRVRPYFDGYRLFPPATIDPNQRS